MQINCTIGTERKIGGHKSMAMKEPVAASKRLYVFQHIYVYQEIIYNLNEESRVQN